MMAIRTSDGKPVQPPAEERRQYGIIIGMLSVVLVFVFAAGIYQFAVVNPRADSERNQLAQELAHSRKAAHKAQHEQTQTLVRACQDNFNQLAAVVRGILMDQIAQSKNADLSRFFPNIPPDQLQVLINKQIRKEQTRIQEAGRVHCGKQYHQDPPAK